MSRLKCESYIGKESCHFFHFYTYENCSTMYIASIWWAVARVVHSLLQLSAEIVIIIIYILLSFYIGCFLF